MLIFARTAIFLTVMSSMACADDLVVYGAGSLREAIGQIASDFGRTRGLTVIWESASSSRSRRAPWIEAG